MELMKSYRTAIKRNKISRPVKKLLELNLIPKNKILDYGCGKEDDVNGLSDLGHNIKGFDPYWKNDLDILKNKYNVILCTYVFCTVSKNTRTNIKRNILDLLTKNGKAYISVRRDVKSDKISKIGSKQYFVKLKLPIVYENADYCIYKIERYK
jgi:hypothetical protein